MATVHIKLAPANEPISCIIDDFEAEYLMTGWIWWMGDKLLFIHFYNSALTRVPRHPSRSIVSSFVTRLSSCTIWGWSHVTLHEFRAVWSRGVGPSSSYGNGAKLRQKWARTQDYPLLAIGCGDDVISAKTCNVVMLLSVIVLVVIVNHFK